MVAFIIGALCSVAAGFSGMRSATSANGRTAQAAQTVARLRHLPRHTMVEQSWV